MRLSKRALLASTLRIKGSQVSPTAYKPTKRSLATPEKNTRFSRFARYWLHTNSSDVAPDNRHPRNPDTRQHQPIAQRQKGHICILAKMEKTPVCVRPWVRFQAKNVFAFFAPPVSNAIIYATRKRSSTTSALYHAYERAIITIWTPKSRSQSLVAQRIAISRASAPYQTSHTLLSNATELMDMLNSRQGQLTALTAANRLFWCTLVFSHKRSFFGLRWSTETENE